MAGALAMKKGDWRTCEQHVLSLSVWSLCPNADAVRAMLRQKIKEESLRTFLFAHSGIYDSLSLDTLSYVTISNLPFDFQLSTFVIMSFC